MLVVFGSVNADLVFEVHRLPRPGETVASPGFTTVPGGKGGNQAVAAAKAGATVRLFGAVGSDEFGAMLRSRLEAAGIDCAGLVSVQGPSGVAVIGVEPGGENAIIVGQGANALVRQAQVPDAALGPGTTVLCQNEIATAETLAVLARARALGARTILNLAPAEGIVASELGDVTVLIVNEHEARALAGADDPRHAARALTTDTRAVVITLGGAGVIGAQRASLVGVPSLPVDVVDTTGAGDAFAGVLAASLDQELPFADCLRRAAVAGGLACGRVGAQSALPTRAEIEAQLPRLGPVREL